MEIDEIVPILTEKVKEWEKRKKIRLYINARIVGYTQRKKYAKWKKAAHRLGKYVRHKENVKRFRAMVRVAVEVSCGALSALLCLASTRTPHHCFIICRVVRYPPALQHVAFPRW